jgi:ornithine carbamoyltransferase
MTRFGMDVTLAHPEGYDLMPEMAGIAQKNAEVSGGRFHVAHSMEEAFADADIVYPKSWAPYSVMEKRTRLLREGKAGELDALEKECIEINSRYTDWECTGDLMAKTKGGEALYMHCLPADITGVSCKAGEVQADVFEKYRLRTYNEAEHKLYVMAAMIILNRFKQPAAVLSEVLNRNKPIKIG